MDQILDQKKYSIYIYIKKTDENSIKTVVSLIVLC